MSLEPQQDEPNMANHNLSKVLKQFFESDTPYDPMERNPMTQSDVDSIERFHDKHQLLKKILIKLSMLSL